MCGILVEVVGACAAGDEAARAAAAREACRQGGIQRRGPDGLGVVVRGEVVMCSSVLRMRPEGEWRQPAEDGSGCALAWNGEWYAGGPSARACDTRAVLALAVEATADCVDAAEARSALEMALKSRVKGEYALALWIPRLRTLIYGRDPFGRRSLLARFEAGRLTVASTAVGEGPWVEVDARRGLCAATVRASGIQLQDGTAPADRPPSRDVPVAGPTERDARRAWAADALLVALTQSVERRVTGHDTIGVLFSGGLDSAVLAALADRCCPPEVRIELVNVAFGAHRSDAARAPDRQACEQTAAELRQIAPDRDWRLVRVDVDRGALRRSARRVVALARPNATHMDFNIAAAIRHAAHGVGAVSVSPAVCPACPGERDRNDGLRYAAAEDAASSGVDALSRAARPRRAQGPCPCLVPVGHGKPDRPCRNSAHPKCGLCGVCCRRQGNGICGAHPRRLAPDEKRRFLAARQSAQQASQPAVELSDDEDQDIYDEDGFRRPDDAVYACEARVLLLGMGADELMAGYARHRTAWVRGGPTALAQELALDVGRISQRNLGRDDRVVADAAREARFPFLDEDVVRLVRDDFRVDDIADLDLPPGIGCKRVLRDVARRLGLDHCATLQKRAIQFGTRIAPHSNRIAFGSNRRADGAAPFDIDTFLADVGGGGGRDGGGHARLNVREPPPESPIPPVTPAADPPRVEEESSV